MQDIRLKGILSAQPGLGIIKYWQGIVEIALRVAACVGGFITFIVSAFAVSLPHNTYCYWMNGVRYCRSYSADSAGWLVFVALVVSFYEAFIVVVRFINFNIINAFGKIFNLVDACISGIIAVFLLIGASVLASQDINSKQYSGAQAAAAFSFLLMFGMIALSVWMFVSLIMKWHHHLIHHTTQSQEKVEESAQYSVDDN